MDANADALATVPVEKLQLQLFQHLHELVRRRRISVKLAWISGLKKPMTTV
jgi:hypothetical protein